jgi:periplasmic protein TonB
LVFDVEFDPSDLKRVRVKLFLENRLLSVAFAASFLVHGALLAVRFVDPDTHKAKPLDPGLEVILVNAKHDRKPLKADALAQANLDGGGRADSGRSKSPLPDMRRSEDGDSAKAVQRRIEQLEQQQRMLARLGNSADALYATTDPLKARDVKPQPDGADDNDSAREIARRIAEIAKRIEDENKRPRKTIASPSTMEAAHAIYYSNVRERIEKIGTLNFPKKDGVKLYGELIISISIFQTGEIYAKDKDGGISVDLSSGIPALDQAARRIVQRAAPFGTFPKGMRTQGKDDVFVMITRFKFTRDNALETEIRGGPG